jgi:hypothetical protein
MENKMTADMETKTIALGRVVATPGALAALKESGENCVGYIVCHTGRDHGDIPPEDWDENEFSIKREFRALSAYTLRSGREDLDHYGGRPERYDHSLARGILRSTAAPVSVTGQLFMAASL